MSTHAVVIIPCRDDHMALAQKKQDIHTATASLKNTQGLWNGYGGKQDVEDVSLLATAVREYAEESGATCTAEDLQERAVVRFFWPQNESRTPDMTVTFYLLHQWTGEMRETSEMSAPTFFPQSNLPFDAMLPADRFVFDCILKNAHATADVHFSATLAPQCTITSSC